MLVRKLMNIRGIQKVRERISLGSIQQIVAKPWLLIRLPRYFLQLHQYRKLDDQWSQTSLRLYPCLDDAMSTQVADGYYFYQDCWAARQVFRERPEWMVDVGSTLLLVGILSQFTRCISIDIRPIQTELVGLQALPGSVLALPFSDNQVPCLTSMCVLEHIGLGRYGDPLDPVGTRRAIAEIKRVVRPNGIAVYSVPVGKPLLEFNANRRFSLAEASNFFSGWEMVDACLLTPRPRPLPPPDEHISGSDPVACFCMRKPRK